jgi:hypothetical protein
VLAATTFNFLDRPALAKVTRYFKQLKIVYAEAAHQMPKPIREVVTFLTHG